MLSSRVLIIIIYSCNLFGGNHSPLLPREEPVCIAVQRFYSMTVPISHSFGAYDGYSPYLESGRKFHLTTYLRKPHISAY